MQFEMSKFAHCLKKLQKSFLSIKYLMFFNSLKVLMDGHKKPLTLEQKLGLDD